MDGDAKINFKEFHEGMKSSLTVFSKKRRTQSGTGISRRK
jgi:hypothetical protein